MIYQTKLTNDKIFKALVETAKENGYSVCDLYERVGIKDYPYFTFDDSKSLPDAQIYGCPSMYAASRKVSLVNLDCMLEKLSVKNSRGSFKLNGKYTAVIDYDKSTVTVGCQTFPFETVQQLAKKLKTK